MVSESPSRTRQAHVNALVRICSECHKYKYDKIRFHYDHKRGFENMPWFFTLRFYYFYYFPVSGLSRCKMREKKDCDLFIGRSAYRRSYAIVFIHIYASLLKLYGFIWAPIYGRGITSVINAYIFFVLWFWFLIATRSINLRNYRSEFV